MVSTMFNLKCRDETGIPDEINWGASDYERVAILTSGGHAVLPIDGYDALLPACFGSTTT